MVARLASRSLRQIAREEAPGARTMAGVSSERVAMRQAVAASKWPKRRPRWAHPENVINGAARRAEGGRVLAERVIRRAAARARFEVAEVTFLQ